MTSVRSPARRLTREDWQQILRVQVTQPGAEPVVGAYAAVDGADPLHADVRIRRRPLVHRHIRPVTDTRRRSRRGLALGAAGEERWRAKGRGSSAPPRVRQIYPSGADVPANLLRVYVEFSGPMGRDNALKHIRLLDESGSEVIAPFLPVEAELWTADRTRFTLLFDPGRVKRGIKPNLDHGTRACRGPPVCAGDRRRVARWGRAAAPGRTPSRVPRRAGD